MGEIGSHNRKGGDAPCFLLSANVFDFRQIMHFRLKSTHILTCHRPIQSLTGFAVASFEYSLCIFRMFAYVPLSIHKYAHLPSPRLSLTVFAVGAIKYSLCKFRKFGNVRISFHSCAQLSSPEMCVTVFAVGSIEYVLCSFRQVAHVRFAIHEFTHLASPDNVSDRVCRWLDRVFSLQLYSVW